MKPISSTATISCEFTQRGVLNFQSACEYVKNLPYRRNADKNDVLCVFKDEGGTCSTKHALLKRVGDENDIPDVKLMLGIFKMNALNTPRIAEVLLYYNLIEMPEAHNYLRINGEIVDCTRRGSGPQDFVSDLIVEIEITPLQISDFKIEYHKAFLSTYLEQSRLKFTIQQFWQIREECIAALQH